MYIVYKQGFDCEHFQLRFNKDSFKLSFDLCPNCSKQYKIYNNCSILPLYSSRTSTPYIIFI